MLVGRSHECDHPESTRDVPVLTRQKTTGGSSAEIDLQVRDALESGSSLYEIDEALLRELEPDVILTQDICAVCSIDLVQVKRIASDMEPPPRILSLDPSTIWDVFDDILAVGALVGLHKEAEAAMVRLREGYWTAIDHVNPYQAMGEVAFLEWIDPLFVAGHWTPGMITAAGGTCSLGVEGQPSVTITQQQLIDAAPERIIICPCGMDIGQARGEVEHLADQDWFRALPAMSRSDAVMLVDGNQMFSRPGPRLVDAFRWLVGWINDRSELVPDGFPAEPLKLG